MSKRPLNLVVGVVILGLIVSIVAYGVSASFQAWVQTWLGNPVGLAASATTIAALATLLAVIVGLRGIYVGRARARRHLCLRLSARLAPAAQWRPGEGLPAPGCHALSRGRKPPGARAGAAAPLAAIFSRQARRALYHVLM